MSQTDQAEERFVWVDLETGEQCAESPALLEARAQIEGLERDLRSYRSKLTKAERRLEPEKHAKKHPLYVEIETVHTWWRLATGHLDVEFTAEDFYQALPRWKENGKRKANPCIPALKAVCGAAYDPNTTTRKNGSVKRYDDWELVMRNQSKFREFQARAPSPVKDWLVSLIESNLK